MAATWIQDTIGHAQGVTTCVTDAFGVSVTSGRHIIVTIGTNGGPVTSITDSSSNTYLLAKASTGGGNNTVEQWYAENVTGGSIQITVNVTGISTISVNAQEFSGLVTSSSLDKTAAAGGSGTTADSSATDTTSQDNELVVGSFNNTTPLPWTVGAGFSNMLSENNSNQSGASIGMQESKNVTSTGTYNATATVSSVAWIAVVATYKAAESTTTSTSMSTSSSTSMSTSSTSTSKSTSTSSTSSSTSSTSTSASSVSSSSSLSTSMSTTASTSLSTTTTVLDYFFTPHSTINPRAN